MTGEIRMQRILIIGNSHSIDAFQLLFEVHKAQDLQNQVLLGIVYYSGCSISKHVRFGLESEPAYRYYRNADGNWFVRDNATLIEALQDQPWNLIFLQAA